MVLLVNSIFVSSATINIASYDSTNFIALENLVQLALISTITISPSALIGIINVVCKCMRGSTCTYHTFQALSNILVNKCCTNPLKYQCAPK